MAPDTSFTGKTDEGKDRERLLMELQKLREAYARQAEVIARYERRYKDDKKPVVDVYEELEVQRELIKLLNRQLKEMQNDIEDRNEREISLEELGLGLEERMRAEKANGSERAEEALRESEKRYRELVKYAPVGIYEVDFRNKRLISVNDAMCQMTGYSREELLNTDPFDLLEDRSKIIFQDRIDQWLNGEKPDQNVEYIVKAKDGREIHTALNVTFTKDEKGEPMGATVIGYDITERKRMENALIEAMKSAEYNQLVLETIIQQMPVGIILADASGAVAKNNAAMDRIWRRRMLPTENIEDHGYVAYHPDGRQYEWDEWPLTRSLHRGVEIIGEEMDIQRGDGTKGTVLVSSTPVKDHNGQIVAGVVIDVDITERKKAEEALRESEAQQRRQREFLESLIEHAGSGIAVLQGRELRFTLVNSAYQAIAPHIPMVGKTYREVFPEAADAGAEERIRRVIDTGETWVVEAYNGPIPGKPDAIWQGYVVRLPIEDGQEPSVFSIVWDVTERKRAEEAFRERERLFSFLFEKAPAMMQLSRFSDGTIVDVNEQTVKMYGFSRDELLGKKSSELGVNRDFEGRVAMLRKLQQTGSVHDVEMPLYTKSGDEIIVSNNLDVIELGGEKYMLSVSHDITDRKRMEEELQESEGRFKALSETAPVGISVGSLEHKIIYTNPAYDRILGYDPGELIGRSSHDVYWNPEVRMTWWQTVQDKGGVQNIEVQFKKKDGTPVWVSMNISLISFGGRMAAMGVIQDITERRRAEEMLRKQASLIDLSPDAVIVRRLDGTITFWAHGAEVLYGFTVGEAVGKVSQELLGTRFPEPPEAILRQVEENGNWAGELVHWAKDGREVIVQSRWQGKWDDHGKLLEILESNVDITEWKRTETELIESEAQRKVAGAVKAANEYNRSLIEASLDPLVTISPEGRITDVNAATEKVTGFSRAELIGTDFSNYFTEPGKADEGYLKAFKEASVTDYPLEIKHRDGHVTPVLYNASLLKNDPGNVVGVFAAARDITERKRAEIALQNMNKTLERLVVERTTDLELAKQQAELYLDLMGHDINNMHQIALGYLELARDMPPGIEQTRFLDKPVEVLQRSAQLIKNVRKLQKLHDGVFQTEDVDVCKVLAHVHREFGANPNKAVTLNLNGLECCHVRANELLHDVYANLVGNAIKHTGDRANIVVDLDVVKDNGGRCCRVIVEDDGPGIPDGFKAKIFSRMLKGNNGAKGMGLGLYLVKSLVGSFGGRVWVEDRVIGDCTKGARFVVLLPMVEK